MASLVSINESGGEKLVICCQPSSHSWAISSALIASGIAAALYASDCCVWKLIYLAFAFAAGAWYLDAWEPVQFEVSGNRIIDAAATLYAVAEEAIFDKSSNTIQLTSQNFLQRFICTSCFNRSESVRLEDVVLVKLDDRMEKSNVIIVLIDSAVISVCGCTAEISKTDCCKIVDQIHDFLKLDAKLAPAGGSPGWDLSQSVVAPGSDGSDSSPVADDASSATSSDESFERVSTADLAEYEATIVEAKPSDPAESDAAAATEAQPSAADPLPEQADEQCDISEPAAGENLPSSSPSDALPCPAEESNDVDPATDDTNASPSADP